MDVNNLTNKSFDILNMMTNKGYLTIKSVNLSNELFETLKLLGNCTSCKDYLGRTNIYCKFFKSISEVESLLAKLEREEEQQGKIVDDDELNVKLIEIVDDKLNN